MRAPWRWRWGAILGLTLLWSVIGAAVGYSPVLGIVLAIWLVLWLRQCLDVVAPPPPVRVSRKNPSVLVKEVGGMVILTPTDNDARTTLERDSSSRTPQ